jgi:hypothetical protein
MMKDCYVMRDIAMKRRKKRLENGSISIQSKEYVF